MRVLPPAHRRGAPRGHAGGAPLHRLRLAAPLSAEPAALRAPRLEQTVIFFGCLVVAVILHEISHGVVALWFGDGTAKEAGRLTLNPIPHIDPFGSIVLPAMGAITGLPGARVGEAGAGEPGADAQPAPRHALREPGRAGHNLLLMVAAAVAAPGRCSTRPPRRCSSYDRAAARLQILFSFAVVNLFLGLFNLLPIPPLDGSALHRAGAPGHLAPALVQVPAVRVPRAVPARVLDRRDRREFLDPFYRPHSCDFVFR